MHSERPRFRPIHRRLLFWLVTASLLARFTVMGINPLSDASPLILALILPCLVEDVYVFIRMVRLR